MVESPLLEKRKVSRDGVLATYAVSLGWSCFSIAHARNSFMASEIRDRFVWIPPSRQGSWPCLQRFRVD